MRRAFCTLLVAISSASSATQYEPSFTSLRAFNNHTNSKWANVTTDVMQHEAPGEHNNYDDLITLVHETTHGIHAYIRNHMNNTGKRANGFFVLDDRAVILVEPNIRKSAVARYVPQSLRGFRFGTYITGQTEWDDTPLYVFDEWNAYVNGGQAGVDQVNHNLWNESWEDGVSGVLEFALYALATAQAVKAGDPNYFESYTPFKEFVAWNVARSMEVFRAGAQMAAFKWDKQDQMLNSFLHSSDAAPLRTFTRDWLGADWTQATFGF
ncbi:MAG: hypothetical protein HYR96_11020 [Deltaproteobacteria bacterium]|nr:hypothetical protein [Deltaproteobacteria bacterium]MBI3293974.1 hypothetical protein [Deltaproteobacteria bacterium]